MTEGKLTNHFPHKHLLGIEGLLPTSINFLLNLSDKFFDENDMYNDEEISDYFKIEYDEEINIQETC